MHFAPEPPSLIGAPITGQTPLYCDQTQDWAGQSIYDKSIECYCLDAPAYMPSGSVRFISRVNGQILAQDVFVSR